MSTTKAADPASLDALRARLGTFAQRLPDGGVMWRPSGLDRAIELFDLAADAIASLEAARAAVPDAVELVRTLRNMAGSAWAERYEWVGVLTQAADAIARAGGREAVAWRSWSAKFGCYDYADEREHFKQREQVASAEPLYAAAPAQEWRPIESVPPDTYVLVAGPEWPSMTRMWVSKAWDTKAGTRVGYATHWMPLPEPPK